MKKVIRNFMSVCLCVMLLTVFSSTSYAQINSEAEHAVLVDQTSGNVMWSKNAYEKAYPASTTKLMTAIIYYEKFQNNLNGSLTVGDELNKLPPGSSIMGLEKEEIVTREQLLYGLMLVSGNDAAIVMAYDHSGGIEAFVQVMNDKAKEFGMNSTHFVNPHGFHDNDHYTTAADFAILAREYMKNDKLREIASASKYAMAATNKKDAYTMLNSNRLISAKDEYKDFVYEKATGLKTGFTNRAKNCFVATSSNGYTGLIFVGFGYEHTETRFTEAKKIMEYGFTNFSPVNVFENIKDANLYVDATSFKIPQYQYGNVDSTVQINAKETVGVDNSVVNLLGSSVITAKFSPSLGVTYPINEGDFIGYVEYYAGDTIIYTAKAYAAKYVEDRKMPGFVDTALINSEKGYGTKSFMEQAVNLALANKQQVTVNNKDGMDDTSTETTTSSSSATTGTTKTTETTKTTKVTTNKTTGKTSSGSTTQKKTSAKSTAKSTTTKKAS